MASRELTAIPATAPVNGLVRVGELLLVESALSIFALRESTLRAMSARTRLLDFDALPRIARVPDAWSVSRANRTVWVVDDRRLYRGPLALPFHGLVEVPLGAVASTLRDDDDILGVTPNGDGSRLLLQVTTGDDPAYALFVIRSFAPGSPDSILLEDLGGLAPFRIAWSEAARSFAIASIEAERIVLWDGTSPTGTVLVDVPGEVPGPPLVAEGARLTEVTLNPRGESLRLSFCDGDSGCFYLVSLPLVPDAPPASRTPLLAPGGFFGWAWRREAPFAACIRETDDDVRACLASSSGSVVAECALPGSWSVNCVAWSGDESRLHLGTEHCLGIWTPPAVE